MQKALVTLHPIMFLLNPIAMSCHFLIPATFTSHYVPIKSPYILLSYLKSNNFTSHYVPIKSRIPHLFSPLYAALHPIMFLLNQALMLLRHPVHSTLHPIMFLLNRGLHRPDESKGLLYIPLCSY